jgi:hypothetical protein
MRLSSIGLIGGALLIGAVSAAPSFASTPASVSGSTTFITPAGFTSTVSAENVLSSGLYFPTIGASITPASLPGATTVTKASLTNTTLAAGSAANGGAAAVAGSITDLGGAVIVLPQFTVQGFSIAAESLSVGSGAASSALSPITSFNLAAASVLTNSAAATAGGQGTQLTGNTAATLSLASEGRAVPNAYYSANIDFISAIIKAGAGVNGLD